MKIFVSQVYIEVGANYPFSHHFQIWLSNELTNRVQPSPEFIQTYSADFNLIFRMSAKSKIREPEIKGPTVFRRDSDVEFTIFLPHHGIESHSPDGYRQTLKLLLQSINGVLQSMGMNTSRVEEDSASMIEHILSTPMMIEEQAAPKNLR